MTEQFYRMLPTAATVLVLLLVGWVYWPGQHGPALLDDRSSIMVVEDLKANPALAWDYVTGDTSGPLGRPVSMASFALEKLFLEDSLATSKRVNIILHLFNGALVIWLLRLMFGHFSVPGYRWLALLLGAAWMLSPLYVSSVLYVVQRMAMLTTTFMLLALISFVHWRLRLARGAFSPLLLLLIPLNVVLALLAKENAVVVIPVILVLEALWFQFRDEHGRTIVWLRTLTLSAIALGALGLLFLLTVEYDDLAARFRRRPFSLEERVLTQSRIMWDYVGQLLLPDVSRMGIYHDDIVVSTSWKEPASTLVAILAWAAVLGLGLLLMIWPWGRYLTAGIAWFLLGHSVESTVLSLELYFEHRNYFPGVGLLLLPGALFMLLANRWPEVKAPLLLLLVFPVVWLASLTSSQVQVWSNHPLLILQHLNGHPDSFRANTDMAVQMANLGQMEAARRYSARANEVSVIERGGDRDIRDLALACISNVYVDPVEFSDLGSSDPRRPFSSVITLITLVRLLQDEACPEFDRLAFAERMAQIYLAPDSVATASYNLYHSLAVLENSLQRWENADAYINRFLELRPWNARALLMKLHFSSALGKVAEAEQARESLLRLKELGRLSDAQEETLSLYSEK